MLSKVKVVSQEEYDAHLKGLTGCQDGQSLAECGGVAFKRNGCNSCHSVDGSKIVGPSLKGVYGTEQPITGGPSVIADEQYIRESVMNPMAKIVAGYPAAMPAYAGRINEEQMGALVEYIRSIK